MKMLMMCLLWARHSLGAGIQRRGDTKVFDFREFLFPSKQTKNGDNNHCYGENKAGPCHND